MFVSSRNLKWVDKYLAAEEHDKTETRRQSVDDEAERQAGPLKATVRPPAQEVVGGAESKCRRRMCSLRLSTRLEPCGQYGQRYGRWPEWVSMWRSRFCLRFTPEMNLPHTGH